MKNTASKWMGLVWPAAGLGALISIGGGLCFGVSGCGAQGTYARADPADVGVEAGRGPEDGGGAGPESGQGGSGGTPIEASGGADPGDSGYGGMSGQGGQGGNGGPGDGGEGGNGGATGGQSSGGVPGGSGGIGGGNAGGPGATGGVGSGGAATGGVAGAAGGAPTGGASATGGGSGGAPVAGSGGRGNGSGGMAAGAGGRAGATAGAGGQATGGVGTGGASASFILSIDFQGGSSVGVAAMAATETAGYKPAASWNSLAGVSGTSSQLKRSDGTVTAAQVAWSSPAQGSTGIYQNWPSDSPGNVRMMNGYLDPNLPGMPGMVTVSGLPAAVTAGGYDVYVYCLGDLSYPTSRTYQYSIGATTILVSQMGQSSATFPGFSVAASGGTGNVVIFRNLSGASFTLVATPSSSPDGNLRAPLNGLQIVSPSGS